MIKIKATVFIKNRHLANIITDFLIAGHHSALHRILQIAPDQIEELRERGELHERLECYRAARDDYRRYLERANATIDVVPVRTRLIEVERQLARYH